MIYTERNKSLDKDMDEVFKLSHMVSALKKIKKTNPEEMVRHRNSIIVTLLAHTCDDPNDMMKRLLMLVGHLYETKK